MTAASLAALLLASAAPALAQTDPSMTAPAADPSAAPPAAATGTATTTSTTTTTNTSTLAVGQPVKDKTGAVIGSIADLKAGASGQTATVKMGEQTFAIGASSFVVQDGAAVINATQADLKAMIAKANKPG